MVKASAIRLGLMAKLLIAILVVTIFEGAFRKWGSTLLTYPLVGLRDTLALIGIAYGFMKGYARVMPNVIYLMLLLSGVMIIWGLFQILINNNSFLVYLLGLRFWLLYLWFAVLAACALSVDDFRYIARVIIFIIIAMTPLAIFQHLQPVGSVWNKQVDEGLVFTVASGVVRTTGTFSFTAGYVAFIAMAAPFVLMSLDNRYGLWRHWRMPLLAIAMLFVATVVSGSRGAILFLVLLLGCYAFIASLYGRAKDRARVAGLMIFIGILSVASMFVFNRAVDATQERFKAAAEQESLMGRLAYTFIPQDGSSVIGEGIGMGSNIAAQLSGQSGTFLLAESENARVVLELGLLGWLVLMCKIFTLGVALFYAARIAKQQRRAGAFLLWFVTGLALLSWSIIGQLTINALGYLLFGLAVACLRLERERQFQ